MRLRFLAFPLALLAGLAALGACVVGLIVAIAYPNLPSLHALTDYQPKVPLRVYTDDGDLIGEFGEERRSVVAIGQVPQMLKNAIIAAEDERFYQHSGIDYQGVLRAALADLVSGGRRQGASTITMQVARNFFLSSQKTLTRKLYEALLAFKIEHTLSKDQILQLYINQIYLGERAYGFAAASQTYFGKTLDQLSLAEIAMLAGLPKAPSAYNPIANMHRAKQRQAYVLRRMKDLGYIGARQYAQALDAPLHVQHTANEYPVHAAYVAEMVREAMVERYPHDAYTRGFRVYTTTRSADQEAAYYALRKSLIEYDRSRGYRGPEGFADLPEHPTDDDYQEALSDYSDDGGLLAAVVAAASPAQVKAVLKNGDTVSIGRAGLRFASGALDSKTPPRKRIRRGAVIRVQRDAHGGWEIAQQPEAEAAFISIDPHDGAVRALIGGFDFDRNKYNHVTQAWRQPGSAFKPFVYSAALEKGYTPATVFEDEPLLIDAAVTGGQTWEPRNYDGTYDGPMRLRTALAKSKNLVSIRLLQAIGPAYAQDYIKRFGFDADKNPPYLTMALGAGAVTPWQMARAYAVFANGGYLVEPYYIQKIVDDRGNAIALAHPQHAGDPRLRVIDPRNAFTIDSMLQDVTRYGTAARAARLGRVDIAGKTGTTNDFVDAWFCGFQATDVGIAWVGFDQPKSLGRNETGARVALPIWMDYMAKVLKDVPEMPLKVPPGIVVEDVPADPAEPSDGNTVPEYFYKEYAPKPGDLRLPGAVGSNTASTTGAPQPTATGTSQPAASGASSPAPPRASQPAAAALKP
jgi:penicillin-binding protein 1A